MWPLSTAMVTAVVALAGCSEQPTGHGPITLSRVTSLASGDLHNCAIVSSGDVRCWGQNEHGQLGLGHHEIVGDDEAPGDDIEGHVGTVPLPGRATQLALGKYHSCALLENGSVHCWGLNALGQLGLGHTDNIGDDESITGHTEVDVGGDVVEIVAGGSHTCARLTSGGVRCWGDSTSGELGYGNTERIGDDESPATAGDIDLGGVVTQLSAGELHTCALMAGGSVRCWGRGRRPELDASPGGHGQLGYGHTDDVGDDETPAMAGDVELGAPAKAVAAGLFHTCAILENDAVRCWGRAEGFRGFGQLGYQELENIGDNELPTAVGEVPVGGPVRALSLGEVHTCALLDTGLRCWGFGEFGQLGQGNPEHVGDNEPPSSVPTIDVGGTVTAMTTGVWHTCALLDDGTVNCFGLGVNGQLGYCNVETLGEDESPADSGPVPL